MAYMQQFEYMMPSFINILGAYNLLSVQGKQSFLKAIFGNNLNYTLEGYRTDFINPLFHTNLLIMKQKRLLEIEQPLIKISENSTSGADKTIIEHLHELYLILKAG
jgi:hypothetical protein